MTSSWSVLSGATEAGSSKPRTRAASGTAWSRASRSDSVAGQRLPRRLRSWTGVRQARRSQSGRWSRTVGRTSIQCRRVRTRTWAASCRGRPPGRRARPDRPPAPRVCSSARAVPSAAVSSPGPSSRSREDGPRRVRPGTPEPAGEHQGGVRAPERRSRRASRRVARPVEEADRVFGGPQPSGRARRGRPGRERAGALATSGVVGARLVRPVWLTARSRARTGPRQGRWTAWLTRRRRVRRARSRQGRLPRRPGRRTGTGADRRARPVLHGPATASRPGR
ncbi:hypothetical protein SALBM135S_08615 [Streptomyces alboniger]